MIIFIGTLLRSIIKISFFFFFEDIKLNFYPMKYIFFDTTYSGMLKKMFHFNNCY